MIFIFFFFNILLCWTSRTKVEENLLLERNMYLTKNGSLKLLLVISRNPTVHKTVIGCKFLFSEWFRWNEYYNFLMDCRFVMQTVRWINGIGVPTDRTDRFDNVSINNIVKSLTDETSFWFPLNFVWISKNTRNATTIVVGLTELVSFYTGWFFLLWKYFHNVRLKIEKK